MSTTIEKVLALIKPASTPISERVPWEYYADDTITFLDDDLTLTDVWPLKITGVVDLTDIKPPTATFHVGEVFCPVIPHKLEELTVSENADYYDPPQDNTVGFNAIVCLSTGLFATVNWSCGGGSGERNLFVSITVARTVEQLRNEYSCFTDPMIE